VAQSARGEHLTVIGWNVESNGSDRAVIAEGLANFDDPHVICLQDVRPNDAGHYMAAIHAAYGDSYRNVMSDNGRLTTIFHEGRLEFVESRELQRGKEKRSSHGLTCPPLAVLLKDKAENVKLFVVNVDFSQRDLKTVRRHAVALEAWGQACGVPAIAVGSFNFGFDYARDLGNDAFDAFLKIGEERGDLDNFWDDEFSSWSMIAPIRFWDTKWSDEDGNGVDDFPNTVDDFVFLHIPGPRTRRGLILRPSGWIPATSGRVIVRKRDFPDDERSSCHRPIQFDLKWVKKPDGRDD
jgi:hypothetical protein